MEAQVTFVNGKRRVTLRRHASGIDKSREVILAILGPGYEHVEKPKKDKK